MEKYLNVVIVFALLILAVDIYCLSVSNKIIREAQENVNTSK